MSNFQEIRTGRPPPSASPSLGQRRGSRNRSRRPGSGHRVLRLVSPWRHRNDQPADELVDERGGTRHRGRHQVPQPSTARPCTRSAPATSSPVLRVDATGEYRGNSHFHGSRSRQFGTVILRGRLQCEQVRVGVHGQCLCRPRHLVVHHAVHRRRHRHQPEQITSFVDIGATQPASAAAASFRPPMPKTRRSGTSLGPRMPAWRTRWRRV